MTSSKLANQIFLPIMLVWRAWIPLCLFLACLVAQAGCACESTAQPLNRQILACRSQHAPLSISAPLVSKTTTAGTAPVSFSVTDFGEAALLLALVLPPGRAGVEPALAISYSSSSGDGPLGVGFSLSGSSAITRCPKTMAIDDEIGAVQYDANDALCLDGRRLVVVSQNADTIVYRTLPDTQIKVIGHFTKMEATYFEAIQPTGWVIEYGKTTGTRPLALGGVPRAWLATEMRDVRGNAMTYGYCFAEAHGYTAEYALDEIRYTKLHGDASVEATRAVAFVYGVKDDARTIFSGGMQFQQSLRLDEIQTHADDALVRRYQFEYEQGATTGRTRLTSIEECGADGSCKPPTQFHFNEVERGFEKVATSIETPLSSRASPIFADMNGDGLSDWLVPDATPLSTSSNPITEWRLTRNTGNGFAASKVGLLQEWSFVENSDGPTEPTQLQPELGTVIDYNDDGRKDIFLHDIYNNRQNYTVLQSNADGSFQIVDTGISRPFPIGPAPAHLRGSSGSTHLLDANGDAMPDLLNCDDHGSTPETAALPTWTLHLWEPGGWQKTGTIIEKLQGYPCNLELHTLDTDRNGTTDLVIPGMIAQGGVPSERAPNYYVFRRNGDGTWESNDTNLRIPLSPNRVLFGDFNGDGLPDAVTRDSSGRLLTWMNSGEGFAEKPKNALDWDGLSPQTQYIHLAQPLDWDGNGQTDLLMPLVDAISPNIPRWVILRATGGRNGFSFERIESGIPFEPVLGDAVTLADPHGPRIGDVNGDGAPDIAIILGKQLHLFVNRVKNPDLLVGFSDGLNERDPDNPAFIPNVLISYGHLTDEWIMNGEEPNDPKKESYLYLSHADPTNNCTYPRHCAVGGKRVVREYATNDGQGGRRRFGLRYRDGRHDRLGYGFLGFGERTLTDVATGATTATFYDNETIVNVGKRYVYPFAGKMKSQWRWAPALPNEPNLKRVELLFTDITLEGVPTNGGQSYFTIATRRHTRRMQGEHSSNDSLTEWVASIEANENATMLRDTTVEILDFDEFGNVLETDVSTIGVDLTFHIQRVVKNDAERWILGQIQFQKECSSASGLSQCRTNTRTTNAFGEVETESTASDDGIDDTNLTVAYDERDGYGNVKHIIATDAFGHARESTTIFDDESIFPVKHINALGHETTVEYDAQLGVLKKLIDPNALTTEWSYDSLGRLESEKRPDGSQTTTTALRTRVDGVWRLVEQTTATGSADHETIFDSLGRPVRTFSHGPRPVDQHGKTTRIMQVIEYDRLTGNVAKRSVPITEGTPYAQLQWDVYEFDAIGRELRHTTPWNAPVTTTYDGLVIDSADPVLNHTKTEVDTLGRPVTITDAEQGKTRYSYGPFDTLYTVTDPGNATTKWTRDAFGRVRQLEEPDRGTTIYVHDGFGDLLRTTDALGRVATFDVDALGRVETRSDKLGAQVITTTWTWDTASNGVGRLHSLTSPDGVKTYGYSKRGQTESVILGMSGDAFAAHFAYDDFGRLKGVDYPQPLGMEPFGVTHDYDEHGFLIGVRDKTTDAAFWELKEVDEAGRIQKERFGNDVVTTRDYYDNNQALKSISTQFGSATIQALSYDWDERLNLKSRQDARQIQNTTERFRYGPLNRLTCAYFGLVEDSSVGCDTSYGYAPNGNLTTKSDVGILSYTNPKHPHAVTNSAGASYGYDAVGNQIARPEGVTIAYTPFDLPKAITRPGSTVSFGYDGDQQRIRKISAASETIYFEDLYERIENKATGAKDHRFYVHSPERAIAVVTRGGAEPGTKFLHVDHLGSVETVTNESGAQTEKRSYDGFGARRNPQWGGPSIALTSKTTKGFTGHEEEDEFGLVNMRGRIYDPRIGRFTTTDPIIANVYNGQSFAVYSYVRNNPLTLIDPSGFTEEEAQRLWRVEETGPLGIHITFDKLQSPTPSPPKPTQSADVGASAPPVDISTTGNGDEAAIVIPIIETAHDSGPGTDDPFGVFPPDIGLGYADAVTTFDQLVTGDLAAGRRTFIIEDDPGLARDIRYAFGPERQTIILRPRIGGEAGDDRSRATQNLAFEAILTAATILTPGPLDDMAVAGLRSGLNATVRRVVNSNMEHAASRAIKRAGFGTTKEARTALQEFGATLKLDGLPPGAIHDTTHADRVIVPGFGKGGAVVYQVKDGTFKLKTVLEWRPPTP